MFTHAQRVAPVPLLRRVCASAVSTAFIIYLVLGVAGYATFGDRVMPDVLESYPAGNGIVAVARIMVSLIVTVSYPLQAHPARVCTTTIVHRLRDEWSKGCWKPSYQPVGKGGADTRMREGAGGDDGLQLHILISTAFVLASGWLAFVVTDLGLVLSVVGATGSTIVSYVLPGAVYYVLFPRRPSRWLGLLLLVAGLLIMPVSLYLIFWPAGGGV